MGWSKSVSKLISMVRNDTGSDHSRCSVGRGSSSDGIHALAPSHGRAKPFATFSAAKTSTGGAKLMARLRAAGRRSGSQNANVSTPEPGGGDCTRLLATALFIFWATVNTPVTCCRLNPTSTPAAGCSMTNTCCATESVAGSASVAMDSPASKGTSAWTSSTSGVVLPGTDAAHTAACSDVTSAARTGNWKTGKAPAGSGSSKAIGVSSDVHSPLGFNDCSASSLEAEIVALRTRSPASFDATPGIHWPLRSSACCSACMRPGCSRSRGCTPVCRQCAAAMPTACPLCAQVAITRVDPKAMCDAEINRPVSSRFGTFREYMVRSGMV